MKGLKATAGQAFYVLHRRLYMFELGQGAGRLTLETSKQFALEPTVHGSIGAVVDVEIVHGRVVDGIDLRWRSA